MSLMWRLAEGYLHICGEEYQVTKINGNTITLKQTDVAIRISVWSSKGRFLYSIYFPIDTTL